MKYASIITPIHKQTTNHYVKCIKPLPQSASLKLHLRIEFYFSKAKESMLLWLVHTRHLLCAFMLFIPKNNVLLVPQPTQGPIKVGQKLFKCKAFIMVVICMRNQCWMLSLKVYASKGILFGSKCLCKC